MVDVVTPADIEEQRRLNWRDFHPEKYCHRCGRLNVWSWAAPSPLWNAVMRDPETGADRFGVVCPPCFAQLAEETGVVPPRRHSWYFAPDLNVVPLWTDADGREWDGTQWLWVEPG